ncbi:MAG: hypothetical protein IJU64_07140 [Bacilli bacterium]|nr:hypothetical protein [Bacilli bacterium]
MSTIEEKIGKIKEKLSNIDTIALLMHAHRLFIPTGNSPEELTDSFKTQKKTKLKSPMMQYKYLIGLLLSTDYKGGDSNLGKLSKRTINNLEYGIERITNEYQKIFLIAASNNIESSKETKDKLLAAFQDFSDYFYNSSLKYPEQEEFLIKRIYGSFDDKVDEKFSLVAQDFLDFYHFVNSQLEKSFADADDTIKMIFDTFKEKSSFESQKELDDFINKNIDRSRISKAISNLCCIRASNLEAKFGTEKAKALLDLFAIKRERRDFTYFNSDNPFSKKPLVFIDEDRIFVTYPSWILDSIYELLDETFKNDNKISKHKGVVAEDLSAELLVKILGSEAIVHRNVCEKPGTDEHDLLIEYKNYILISETKASKHREPLFNPDKAIKRFYDHFFSDSGIGYAYYQAIKLKKYIESNNKTTLFESKAKKFVIEDIDKKQVIPIVLTLERFGSIAANPSTLIKEEKGQPLPWVSDIADLGCISEIFEYLGKNGDDFIGYLQCRISKQKQIFVNDELEILEYYFEGELNNLNPSIVYFFEPKQLSLMDYIYFTKMGIPYIYNSPLVKNNS